MLASYLHELHEGVPCFILLEGFTLAQFLKNLKARRQPLLGVQIEGQRWFVRGRWHYLDAAELLDVLLFN
jgi:hypothetical protein